VFATWVGGTCFLREFLNGLPPFPLSKIFLGNPMGESDTKKYLDIGLSAQGSDLDQESQPNVELIVSMQSIKLSQVLKRELGNRKQTNVAKECGIGKSLLNDWLSARRIPSAKNLPQLYKLAKYLGLTLEQLLFDTSPTSCQTISSTRFTDGGVEYRVNIEKVR
jgi:transcriptional regulator with XRE-family HTH domain